MVRSRSWRTRPGSLITSTSRSFLPTGRRGWAECSRYRALPPWSKSSPEPKVSRCPRRGSVSTGGRCGSAWDASCSGRVFDGLGRPRDGLPPPLSVEERSIDGSPINPCRREYPREFLETGISAIDGLNSFVLGQKLPIFSESGLAHDALAMQIIRQARAPGVEKFVIVFVALGLPRERRSPLRAGLPNQRRSDARRRVPQLGR